MDSLLDFGTGFFTGGESGAKMSKNNPYVTGASAIGMGALSYFGGASQRKLEKKANNLALQNMEQDLELGEFKLSDARRNRAKEAEEKKRKETFGKLLAQYFQRKQGGV